jgi:UDP-2,3-diacylglucosamine pyrophosphatase LpxH
VILDIEEDRLFVVSDLHLGNPASTAATRILPFLDHVANAGASLCINGDGLDILQTRFKRIVSSGMPVLARFGAISDNGGRVYYVIGNHDLVLEHFFDSVLTFDVSPFLNVVSGDARIRIEHGHVYDPFFARYPDLYEFATRLAGVALFAPNDTYRVWTWLAERLDRWRRDRAGEDLTAVSYCHGAAEMLLGRGFDAVLFGHTHNAEHLQMPSGAYVNCGNWLRGRTYVEIDHGRIDLKAWES